jgi:hypothetical protein
MRLKPEDISISLDYLKMIQDAIKSEYKIDDKTNTTILQPITTAMSLANPSNLESAIKALNATTDEYYPLYLTAILIDLFSAIKALNAATDEHYTPHLTATLIDLFSEDNRQHLETFDSNLEKFINSIDFNRLSTTGITAQSNLTRQIIVFTLVSGLFINKDLFERDNREEILKNAGESLDDALIERSTDHSFKENTNILNMEIVGHSFVNFVGYNIELIFNTNISASIDTPNDTDLTPKQLPILEFTEIFTGTILYDVIRLTICFWIGAEIGSEYYHLPSDIVSTNNDIRSLLEVVDFRGVLDSLVGKDPSFKSLLSKIISEFKDRSDRFKNISAFLRYNVFKNDEPAFLAFIQENNLDEAGLEPYDFIQMCARVENIKHQQFEEEQRKAEQAAIDQHQRNIVEEAVIAATKPLKLEIEKLASTVNVLAQHLAIRETDMSELKSQIQTLTAAQAAPKQDAQEASSRNKKGLFS